MPPVNALTDKSIHDLRSIAQGYGITNLFQLDKNALLQAIQLKQSGLQPDRIKPPELEPYDGRLLGEQPLDTTPENLNAVLSRHIAMGLKLSFLDPDAWHMKIGNREDTGTMHQPLRLIVQAADNLLRA